MTRLLNRLFHDSPYLGWFVPLAVLGLLGLVWLLYEYWVKDKHRVVRARSALFAAFVALDLFLLIVLGSLHVWRWDVTRDKLYSLSPINRELVSKLDDTVTVEVFFPENVPPELLGFREAMTDLLDEFQAASGGHLTVKYLDPNDAGVAERAKALGIEPQPFTTFEAGKPVPRDIIRGVALSYRGRTVQIPVIDKEVGLEYQVTTLLRTLTGTPRKIGILTGHKELDGAFDQPQVLDLLKNVLSYQDLVTVDLAGGEKPVPDDIQALILSTPADPIPDAELYRIDQFAMRGGALAFLGNGFSVVQPPQQMQMMGQMQMPEVKPLDPKLAEFLGHFGLVPGDDVVLDDDTDDGVRQRVTGMQVTRGGAIRPEYSLMTTVFQTKDVAEDHPVTFGIQLPLIYQSSTMDVSEAIRARGDVEATILMQTPENSWAGSSSDVMFPVALGGMPPQKPELPTENATDVQRANAERRPRPLAVAVEGPMTSFYAGKEVPAPATADGRKDKSDVPVRVLGMGSPLILIPEALKGGLGGHPLLKDLPTLLLNAADWMLAEKGLLEVRGKTAEPPAFKREPDAAEQSAVTALFVFGWPFLFLVVALGNRVLVRMYRRAPTVASETPPARARSRAAAEEPAEEPEADEPAEEESADGEAKASADDDPDDEGKEVKP